MWWESVQAGAAFAELKVLGDGSAREFIGGGVNVQVDGVEVVGSHGSPLAGEEEIEKSQNGGFAAAILADEDKGIVDDGNIYGAKSVEFTYTKARYWLHGG